MTLTELRSNWDVQIPFPSPRIVSLFTQSRAQTPPHPRDPCTRTTKGGAAYHVNKQAHAPMNASLSNDAVDCTSWFSSAVALSVVLEFHEAGV